MNAECSTCHFQHFPKLNTFGRQFVATGFSQTGQQMLEGDSLSVPPTLNASFFIKTRVWDDNTIRPKWDFPDESALLVGGRLTEGAGGFMEMANDLLSYKISYTRSLDNGLNLGMTGFATDGLGASFGFELMNTGSIRNHRPFERASKASQGQGGLDLSGAATGVALHAHNSDFYAAVTFYMPDSVVAGHTKRDTGGDLSTYARLAWTPNLGGNDVGIGVGGYSGKTTATCDDADLCTADVLTDFVTEAWYLDAQFQGEVGGKELGAYLLYAQGGKDDGAANTVYLHNAGYADVPRGLGLDMEYSVTPKVHVLASVSRHDNGHPTLKAMDRVGLGAYVKLAQNLTIQPMYETFSGEQASKDHRATLLFETAF
ncbi:MAG: hypothetical protein A2V90_04960 [Gammaproteobacteria bacterium RBG_16_57_12]|nr:MAG: hypothetical protein A2V90_04960 [Gammaproteobacteria bacterium RBG_16_57_12]